MGGECSAQELPIRLLLDSIIQFLIRMRSEPDRATFDSLFHSTLKIQNSKWIPIAIIVAVILAWFSPWWISGKNLAPLDLQNRMMSPWRGDNATEFAKNHIVSDAVDQYLVYRMVAADSYAKEGWLGWSSLTYGGTAQYANTMALYYDWTMQLHRWFSFWTAWHLGLLGQILLAAIGMFVFLRGRSIDALWACCGALAYAANSQFVTWIYHRWALGAFCWVPWILWAIDSYRQGRRFSWTLVPAFIAMAFLGGTLQHAALVVLVVAAMWLEEAFLHHSESNIQNLKSRIATQWRVLGRYAAWGLLGSGLAAMMLLPCTDAFLTSNRLGLHTGMVTNAGNSIYPQGLLQPLFNLAAYPFQVFPSILGRCDSLDTMKAFKSDLFYIVYFGSLPVWIAFLALWRRQSPVLARLLIAAGLLLPLSPLVRYLYQRLFLLFVIGGILAFVHFMQHAGRETKLRVFKVTSTLFGIATLAWITLSATLWLKPGLMEPVRQKLIAAGSGSSFGYFQDWIVARVDRFIGDLIIWSPHQLIPLMLLALALWGLAWSASLKPNRSKFGGIMVVMAVIGEVTLFGSRWVAWSDPAKDPLFPTTPETIALQEFVGKGGRVSTLTHPTVHMTVTPFVPNTLSAYGIATISGYDSIVPDGMVLPNESAGDAEKLGRLGVSHLVTWPGNPGVPPEWRPIWQSPLMDLYQNPHAVPKYAGWRTATEKERFFGGENFDGMELRESSGLENSRKIAVPAGIEWIRIAENQADGWEYKDTRNDVWLRVDRAADASMLIHNPDSSRAFQLEMRYRPPLRQAGFAVSGVSLLLLVAGTLFVSCRSPREAGFPESLSEKHQR